MSRAYSVAYLSAVLDNRSVSAIQKDFSNLCYLSVDKWSSMLIKLMFTQPNSEYGGLTTDIQ